MKYCCDRFYEKVNEYSMKEEKIKKDIKYFISLENFKNKFHIHTRIHFCPFCGEKLKEQSEMMLTMVEIEKIEKLLHILPKELVKLNGIK